MTPADKLYEWLREAKVNAIRYILHGYEAEKILFEEKTNMGEDRSEDEEWIIYPSDLPLKYARADYILASIGIDTCGNLDYAELPDFTMKRKEGKYDASLDWEILRDMVKEVLEE